VRVGNIEVVMRDDGLSADCIAPDGTPFYLSRLYKLCAVNQEEWERGVIYEAGRAMIRAEQERTDRGA
jgi:hypothetical protein